MYVVFTHPPTIRPKDLVIVVLQIRQFIEVEKMQFHGKFVFGASRV